MKTMPITTAQALVAYLKAQECEPGVPFIAGVWAVVGHGNVAGLGEALYPVLTELPTWRGHYEQGMAHAATAYAKALNRRRAMAVTTSIGPGATNIDFAGHARALGAEAEKVDSIAKLEEAIGRARCSATSYCIVIDTDPAASTEAGGSWWDVAVPELSTREEVQAARAAYETAHKR